MSREVSICPNRPLKILIVCHDREMSGANRSLYDWLSARDPDLISPTVLISREEKGTEDLFRKIGCEVWIVPYVNAVRHLDELPTEIVIKDVVKRIYSKVINPLLALRVAKKAKKAGIDLVHSNSFATLFGALVSRYSKLPHVWHIREFGDLDHGFVHYNTHEVSDYCASSNAIFISGIVQDVYESRYRFRSTRCIENRIAYDPSFVRTRSFMEDGTCNMIIVGSIIPGKGQADAVAATKLLRDAGIPVHLYICGQGDPTALIEALGGEWPSYITFLGYRDDVTSIRKNMDIALVCSRKEAFGRVTIEALYYGNVVVGANSGCTPYLIQDGYNGFLYTHGDPASLAESIKGCIENKNQMGQIASRASSEARERYAGSIACKIERCYREVLELG